MMGWILFLILKTITDTIWNLFFADNIFTETIINDTDPTEKQYFANKRYVDNILNT